MTHPIRNLTLGGLALAAAVTLASCGGGGGGSAQTGSLSLSITDAALDSLPETASVIVSFTGIELQPQSGDRVMFEFNPPKQINLVALTGNLSEPLLGDFDSDDRVTVPAGSYNWIRLIIEEQKYPADLNKTPYSSFVDHDGDRTTLGDQFMLYIPSGAESGLKLNAASEKVIVAAGGEADFVIDFDLRNSVFIKEMNPKPFQDAYKLRPTIRIVNRLEVGSISGTATKAFVDAELAKGTGTACAVYVFPGPASPLDDIDAGADGVDAADGPEPLTSASLEAVPEGADAASATEYTYEVGFLAAGDYTLAVTCQADLDNVGSDVPVDDDATVFFSDPIDVTLAAGEAKTDANFPATP